VANPSNLTLGPSPTFPVAWPSTSLIFDGQTALVPQFAVINASSSGVVIAGVPGLRIRVIAMDLVTNNAVTIQWQTSTGPATISGPQSFAANGGIVRPFNQAGWFQTLVGDSLNITLSGGATVGGNITYVAL
jgi:hypothetical protein